MKEQKEFSMDTNAMFEELRDKFEEYPEINLLQKANNELPELFWLDGIFGLSRSTLQQGDKEIASAHYYQFVQSIETNNRFLNLVTNDVYFSFGYDQLHKYGPALTCDFAIQSRLLVRLLYYDKYYPVAAPLVIFKKGYVP